jgi:ABC-type uncharacterized transport system auxiliary subunit
MKSPRPRCLLSLVAPLAISLVLVGCSTAKKTPDTVTLNIDPEKEITIQPSTGTRIPSKKKLKDVVSADRTKKSQTQEYDPEELLKMPPGRQPDKMGR